MYKQFRKKRYFKILVTLLSFLGLSGLGSMTFGQGEIVDIIYQEETELYCPDISYNIQGPGDIVATQLYEYTVITDTYDQYASGIEISNEISYEGDIVQVSQEQSISNEFAYTGVYILDSQITLASGCKYSTSKDISSYEDIIIYLGKGSDVLNINKPGTGNLSLLIKEIQVDSNSSNEKLFSELSSFSNYFKDASRIIMDTGNQGNVFEALGRVFTTNTIDTSSKNVYVLADINQSYFRRLLGRYVTAAGLPKVFVLEDQYFGSLFTSLLLGENPDQYDFIKTYSVDLRESNKRTFLSYMTDYLLLNGFPLGILTLVLLLPFVGLLISVARQVIGLSTFGVFTPLLFAACMYVIGIVPSLLLLAAATIAVILVNLVTRKIYLLYSPKIAMMIILYCIFALLLRRLHEFLGLGRVDMGAYSNNFVIFPFIAILIVSKGVFSDSFLQFKKGWIFTLLEFTVISFGVLYIFTNDYLQNIFLGNPELILVVLILNVLVGRFTGLQIMEYFRFFPLIRNYFEEE